MQKLYCISGLGADERVFQHLDLSFAHPVFITWINPLPGETLEMYARRLKEEFIGEENPLIIGLSLGGMLATEIAKQLPKANVIIISSAKTRRELPLYWRFFRYIPVYKILTYNLVKQTQALQEYFLGAGSQLSRQYEKTVIGLICNFINGPLALLFPGKIKPPLPTFSIYMAVMTGCFRYGLLSQTL